MKVIPYLNDLQTGVITKGSINKNFLLKKLSCVTEDVFVLDGEEYDVPPFAAKFCSVPKCRNILAISSEDGEVLLLNTNYKAKKSLIKRWKAHHNAIFDLCWLNDEYKLITVSGDHQAILWDPTTEQKLAIFKGHSSSIKCVACQPNSKNVFATASRDGSIMIWDTRCNKNQDSSFQSVITIRDAHNAASLLPGTPKHRAKRRICNLSGNPLNSVTSIVFQNDNLLFSAGTADAVIKVWDIRKNYSNMKKETLPFKKFPYKGNSTKAHGYTSLNFNENRSILYASCTDSVIYSYNCHSYNPLPLATYFGHKTSTFFVKMTISGDGKYLLSGSSDNKAYIWNTSQPGKPFTQLIGHQAEVTAVAWNPNDFTKIVTCSDDVHVYLWDIKDHLEEVGNTTLGVAELHQSISTNVLKSIENSNDKVLSCSPTSVSPKTSNSVKLKVSPEITRWFKPSGGSFLITIPTIDCNDLHKSNQSSCRKRRHSETTPKKQTENYQEYTQTVLPPDENRVLTPKNQINVDNVKCPKNVRRTLDLNQETDECVPSIYSSINKNKVEVNELCTEENTENQLINKEKHKNSNLIKVVKYPKQFGLITNYFSFTSDTTN